MLFKMIADKHLSPSFHFPPCLLYYPALSNRHIKCLCSSHILSSANTMEWLKALTLEPGKTDVFFSPSYFYRRGFRFTVLIKEPYFLQSLEFMEL